MTLDPTTVAFLIIGASAACFVAGLAGFGTALVASGLFFHALPEEMVPPLIVLSAVTGHITALTLSRRTLAFRPTVPFLIAGAAGVPIGVACLSILSPNALKGVVGAILIAYCLASLMGAIKPVGAALRTRSRDAAVGGLGGVFGGIAGLSGVPPLVWLQISATEPVEMRNILQCFNLIILSLSAIVMGIGGHIDGPVLEALVVVVPAAAIGAVAGSWAFTRVSPRTFQRIVLAILLISGITLVWKVIF